MFLCIEEDAVVWSTVGLSQQTLQLERL